MKNDVTSAHLASLMKVSWTKASSRRREAPAPDDGQKSWAWPQVCPSSQWWGCSIGFCAQKYYIGQSVEGPKQCNWADFGLVLLWLFEEAGRLVGIRRSPIQEATMYICIYIYTHTYIHTYTYIYMHLGVRRRDWFTTRPITYISACLSDRLSYCPVVLCYPIPSAFKHTM